MWIAIIILLVVAILQILYVFWLSVTMREARPVRQPSGPIMPTTPQGMNTQFQNPAVRIGGGKLVVVSGLPGQKEILVPGNNFGIGRFYSPESNILVAFDEKSISRRHAIFMGDESLGEFYLTDTNSSYGTSLRKDNKFELLTPGQRERIYNEDVVQFGNTVTIRFLLPSATRAAATRF
jgi:pSer/pThr/pTyr-binding forkhead associated (FHA) protein